MLYYIRVWHIYAYKNVSVSYMYLDVYCVQYISWNFIVDVIHFCVKNDKHFVSKSDCNNSKMYRVDSKIVPIHKIKQYSTTNI